MSDLPVGWRWCRYCNGEGFIHSMDGSQLGDCRECVWTQGLEPIPDDARSVGHQAEEESA